VRVPRYKQNFSVQSIEGAGTFLLTETLPTVLNGALNERVCPLIDGERSVDDIVAALRDEVQPAQVYYALNVLEVRGFIEEADDSIPATEHAFWQACGVSAAVARERLAANPVQVVCMGAVDEDTFVTALAMAGVRFSDDDAAITIVCTDDYRYNAIADIDDKAFANDQRWGLVKPIGAFPFIGPFFVPGRSGSYRDMATRMRMNYTVDAFVEERIGAVPVTALAATDATVGAASELAATEVAKWIALDDSQLVNTLVSMSVAHLTFDRHPVSTELRGTNDDDRPPVGAPIAIPFESRLIIPGSDGGHRTATPAETLQKYEHLVSPITGVVSRLASVSPPDHPLVHAYSANHNWATSPDSLAFLKQSLRSQSGGKGTTEEQAKVGAMAEAFERYSGVYRGNEYKRTATMDEMGPDAIHPHDVLLFSGDQYERRDEIRRQGNSFQMVTDPFDPSIAIDWSPMWAPTADQFRWVPTGLLYYSYAKVVPCGTPNRLAYFADSNGCAAGNSLEEAALQGMLELVERDAVATWWYNEVRRPAFNLDELRVPYLDDLRAWLDTEARDLWVLDITNDVGIPVFAAVSRLRDAQENGSENVVVGFGAHLDPQLAIMRAITEVNQFFASLFALGDGELGKAFDPGAVEWWNTASVANKGYLLPADGEVRGLADYAGLTSTDLNEEVRTTVSMIEARGLEVLLLDQTRPEVGFPVVKALVPGMRHFWSRLAPGRLYDVPVELGWLAQPRREDELNPTPVFF
jgi:ribosomal protein S12 methylthiotransferase accessory factor